MLHPRLALLGKIKLHNRAVALSSCNRANANGYAKVAVMGREQKLGCPSDEANSKASSLVAAAACN
eukprot:5019930-Amphidinium_carterae.1